MTMDGSTVLLIILVRITIEQFHFFFYLYQVSSLSYYCVLKGTNCNEKTSINGSFI